MSSPEYSDFNPSRHEQPQDHELSPDWHLPLYETVRKQRLNDWYTYLWCFCEISKRTVESINISDPIWLEKLIKEVQKLKAIGSRLDKRKNTPEDDADIRQNLEEFINECELEKPQPTKIRHFKDDLKTIKELLHDLKNAHTPIYLSLYVYQKAPSDETEERLVEQLIYGFRKLHTYAKNAEQVLRTVKLGNKNEVQEIPLEEINLFQLFEAIEQDLLSNLRAEDSSKSVQLEGLNEIRQFIEDHSNLIFMGRAIDIKGLLSNIAKNCVEQYREVRDTRFPNRANDARTMSLHMELEKTSVHSDEQNLIVSLTIVDRATGFTPKILQFGFTSGESEKPEGWGVGLGDYVPRLASYGIEMQFGNYGFDTGHAGDQNGTGSITTVLIPVKEKYQ